MVMARTSCRESRPRLPRAKLSDFEEPESQMLSERERAVLQAVVVNGSTIGVARALGISEFTVKNYLTTIYRKLGVASRSGAVVEAVRRGLIHL